MNKIKIYFTILIAGFFVGCSQGKHQRPKPIINDDGMMSSKKNNKLFPPRGQWVGTILPPGVTHNTFNSISNKTDIGYSIYLPEAYKKNPNKRFPVIYYLHGGTGNELRETKHIWNIDNWIKYAGFEPMIMVFPNGMKFTSYDNIPNGYQIATSIIKELIPEIDKKYRTIASKKGRSLIGFSMGGEGSIKFLFKHPEMFSAAWTMAPGSRFAYSYSETETLQKNLDRIKGKVSLRISVGADDFLHEYDIFKYNRYKKLGIDCELFVLPDVSHSSSEIFSYEKGKHAKESIKYLMDIMSKGENK